MPKVEVGNISTQQQQRRGWLVGQFFPEDSQFKDDTIEVYVKKITAGDQSDKLHKHPLGKEYLILLSGKIKIQVADETIELNEGDYIAIPPETPDKIVEVLEDSVIAGVRYPSVPNNKILLE